MPAPAPAPAPIIIREHGRSVMWPILAVGMLGIAGAALFLVWRQSQQPQAPVLQITQTPDNRNDHPGSATGSERQAGGEAGDAGPTGQLDPAADAGAGKGSSSGRDARHKSVGKGSGDGGGGGGGGGGGKAAYNTLLRASRPELQACVVDHLAGMDQRPDVITLKLQVGANGQVKRVALQPDKLSFTPMGACMRNVMQTVTFPSAADEIEISVQLTVPAAS
jgi:hypothetical protein